MGVYTKPRSARENNLIELKPSKFNGFALPNKPLLNCSSWNVNIVDGGGGNIYSDTMYDDSGNAYNLTQGTVGNCPKYQVVNGIPELKMDNTSATLIGFSRNSINGYANQNLGQSDLTILTVNSIFSGATPSTVPVYFCFVSYTNNSLSVYVGQVRFSTISGEMLVAGVGTYASPSNKRMVTVRIKKGVSTEIWVDEGVVAISALSSNALNGTIYVGNGNAGNTGFRNNLNHFAIYDRYLSDEEIIRASHYMKNRYNYR